MKEAGLELGIRVRARRQLQMETQELRLPRKAERAGGQGWALRSLGLPDRYACGLWKLQQDQMMGEGKGGLEACIKFLFFLVSKSYCH